MNLSIIIPAYNEANSITFLIEEINNVLCQKKLIYEIILIDDGSTDDTWDIIQNLSSISTVKGIRFKKNLGKSAALDVGFIHAKGKVVITMDGDLQDDPNEILDLYDMINSNQFDMVSGWKKKRLDPLSKTIPTRLYNWTTRLVSGINLHDFNCGLKAYSLNVVKDIRVSGEMHRYIPILVKHQGYSRIGEKIINHRARKYGITKYGGWNRFSNGVLDLISISFINRFGSAPMHLFGFLGILSFLVGFIIALYLTYTKLFLLQFNITDRPLFYLGILCMILGSQLFLSGFLGELIIRQRPIDHLEKINNKTGFESA